MRLFFQSRIFKLLLFSLSFYTLFLAAFSEVTDPVKVLFILACALTLWISEVIPVAVTGLLIIVFTISTGVLSSNDAFSVFGSPIIVLLLCVLILTRVVVVSGLAERIAVHLMCSRVVGSSVRSLCIGLAFVCWLLAWWISNTAACALFLPIVLGLIPKLDDLLENEDIRERVKHRLLLTCAFTPSIGGMVTPVGSLPNLVSIESLRQQGIILNFGDWMGYGLPISFVLMGVLMVLLELLFPIPYISLDKIKPQLERESTLLPSLRYEEICIGISFLMTVVLWLMPSISQFIEISFLKELVARLSVAVSAIIGVFVLFFLLAVGKEQRIKWSHASEFDWGIMFLFAGGLCLGKAILETGVPEMLFSMEGVGTLKEKFLAMTVIPVTILLSEVCSNTVAAAIMVPFVLSIETEGIVLPVITAFSAGFGFMLPISTPPNAIVFGSGKLPLKKMLITGFCFDILGAFILYGYFWILS